MRACENTKKTWYILNISLEKGSTLLIPSGYWLVYRILPGKKCTEIPNFHKGPLQSWLNTSQTAEISEKQRRPYNTRPGTLQQEVLQIFWDFSSWQKGYDWFLVSCKYPPIAARANRVHFFSLFHPQNNKCTYLLGLGEQSPPSILHCRHHSLLDSWPCLVNPKQHIRWRCF